MLINTEQWRAGIGTFHGRISFSTIKRACCDPIIIFESFFNFFYNSFLAIPVMKTGDIELNLRPSNVSFKFLLLPLE